MNPGARLEHKRLPHEVIEQVLGYAGARGIEVFLLDAERRHAHTEPRVRHYAQRGNLHDDIEILRHADLYIGADSFFLHLAYHFDLPLFAIVPPGEFYFAPPGLANIGGVLTIPEAARPHCLATALDALCS